MILSSVAYIFNMISMVLMFTNFFNVINISFTWNELWIRHTVMKFVGPKTARLIFEPMCIDWREIRRN